MTERIAVGDLVQVVRWPHPCKNKLGKIFVIGWINEHGIRCQECGEDLVEHGSGAMLADSNNGCPISWVKRIPPLSELEKSQTSHDLDVKEPA